MLDRLPEASLSTASGTQSSFPSHPPHIYSHTPHIYSHLFHVYCSAAAAAAAAGGVGVAQQHTQGGGVGVAQQHAQGGGGLTGVAQQHAQGANVGGGVSAAVPGGKGERHSPWQGAGEDVAGVFLCVSVRVCARVFVC